MMNFLTDVNMISALSASVPIFAHPASFIVIFIHSHIRMSFFLLYFYKTHIQETKLGYISRQHKGCLGIFDLSGTTLHFPAVEDSLHALTCFAAGLRELAIQPICTTCSGGAEPFVAVTHCTQLPSSSKRHRTYGLRPYARWASPRVRASSANEPTVQGSCRRH